MIVVDMGRKMMQVRKRVSVKVGLVTLAIALAFISGISRLPLLFHYVQEQLNLLYGTVLLLEFAWI